MSPKRTDWLLPAAIAAVQLGLWPGPALFGSPATDVAIVLATTVTATVALGFRRVRPVTTLAVTHTAVYAAQLAVDTGIDVLYAVPLIALFSVGAWTGARVTVAATAAVVVTAELVNVLTPGVYPGGDPVSIALLIALNVLLTAMIALFGQRRRAWRLGRERARRALAEAERARAEAARAERHRLARELHDVSAHHLTAIVVTVTAASRLAGKRPELAADALAFSAQAARRTLDTLLDLVAVMRGADATGDLRSRVAALTGEFRRLGQPVTVDGDVPGDVPPAVAEAAFAVVREALTNTLRYAPGGAVTIRLAGSASGFGVTVTNGPATRTSDADGIGSGSGLAGARARVEQLGGTLTAGPAFPESSPLPERPAVPVAPGPVGGWQVSALFPMAAGGGRIARAWLGRGATMRGYLTDGVIALLIGLACVGALLAAPELTAGGGRGTALLAGGLSLLHAVPVVWAHRSPWWALGGQLAVLLAWGGLVGIEALPAATFVTLLVAGLAEIYTVYAIAAHGRGPAAVTWLAAPAAATLVGVAVALGAGPRITIESRVPASAEIAVGVALVIAGVSAATVGPLLAGWLIGAAWRRRVARLRAREHDLVAAAVVSADGEALAERWRIAAELRATVLDRATAVLVAASPPGTVPVATGVEDGPAVRSRGSADPAADPPRAWTAAGAADHGDAGHDGSAGPTANPAGEPTAMTGADSPAPVPESASAIGTPPAGPARVSDGGSPVAADRDATVGTGGAGVDTGARLAEVLEAARGTLAAMRELLGGLRGGAEAATVAEGGPETAPQPTAAQIGALCEARRAAGRAVMLRYATPMPELPPGVDVSAYRLVESALELPGEGPLEIIIGVSGGLRICFNRIPALADPRAAAPLRGRVDAVSGAMTVHPAGETDIWLPLQEVRSSPYV